MRNPFRHPTSQAPLSPFRSRNRGRLIRESRVYQCYLSRLKRKARLSRNQRKELQLSKVRNKLLGIDKVYAEPEFIGYLAALELCDDGRGIPYEQLVLEISAS